MILFMFFGLTIQSQDTVFTINTSQFAQISYVKAEDIKEAFGIKAEWNTKNKALDLRKKKKVTIFLENPFIKIENQVVQLVYPMIMKKGVLYIPVTSLPDILSPLIDKSISIKGDTLLYGNANIHNFEMRYKDGETEGIIYLDDNLEHIFKGSGDIWTITIFEGRPLKGIFPIQGKGDIKNIKVRVTDAFTEVKFQLTKKTFDVDVKRSPGKIIMTISNKKRRIIKTVVIDPGHGGKDPGAVGYKGLKEKDVVLDVGKRLAKILKEKGYNIIMTRTTDEFIPLSERTKIADKAKADLFVSIHCNAAPLSRKNGTETYFLSAAKTDWARAVEAKENSSIRFEKTAKNPKPGINYILWDMAQSEFLKESSELAIEIQESLCKQIKRKNRGVSQANFYVLRLNYMPAVLVETAFVSNPREGKLLSRSKFKEKIAEGIANGIDAFAKKYAQRY